MKIYVREGGLALSRYFGVTQRTLSKLDRLRTGGYCRRSVGPSGLLLADRKVGVVSFGVSVSDSGGFSSRTEAGQCVPPSLELSGSLDYRRHMSESLCTFNVALCRDVAGRCPFLSSRPGLKRIYFSPHKFRNYGSLDSRMIRVLRATVTPGQGSQFTDTRTFLRTVSDLSLLRRASRRVSLRTVATRLEASARVGTSGFRTRGAARSLPTQDLRIIVRTTIVSRGTDRTPVTGPDSSGDGSRSSSLPSIKVLLRRGRASSFSLFSLPTFRSLRASSRIKKGVVLSPTGICPVPPNCYLVTARTS